MAVTWGRWIDHLPLWVVLGATISTGIYEPGELAVMAGALGLAAVVEASRWDLGRWQRWLEVGALAFFLGDLARGRGLFAVALHTLFVLAGVRLALPRDPAHRRQLVLIGFMLFLATAIATTDILFLAWTLAWACAAALALLQLTWEGSAALRRGVAARPPYARIPLWVGASVLLGAGFFLIMPRLSLGLRPGALLGTSRALGQAGLGDQIDLGGGGPIEPNPEVAVRVAPPEGIDPTVDPGWGQGLRLLRGITLEAITGFRWEAADLTLPPVQMLPDRGSRIRRADFLYTPSSHGILAVPAGLARLEPLDLPLMAGPGGSIRWRFPRSRTAPVTITWTTDRAEPSEPLLRGRRLQLLTRLGPEHEAARRASLRYAPEPLPAPELARSLEAALQGFTYTLDNPSGQAENPIQDFLERSQAGHCEYFASAMALMLRARGVPARVVNGYRLGPWIPEGGYFRVTQNEAHSWVEYWFEGRWRTADPTPRGALSATDRLQALGALQRWLDTLRYRWERHVVRFSDQDQQAGLSWLQAHLQGLEWHWKAPSRGAAWALGGLVLAWLAWRTRGTWLPAPVDPLEIRILRPLLARTRRLAPPAPGETVRHWILRLAALRPDRAEALARLADAVDAEVYGAGHAAAPALARAEAEVWKGWEPTST